MQKLTSYWKSILWAVIMLVLFLLPNSGFDRSPTFPGIPETVHVLMFAFFTFFLLLDSHGAGRYFFPAPGHISRLKPRIFQNVVLAGLAFGVMIEVLQYLMNLGRTAEIKDLVFDLAGIAAGILLLLVYSRIGTTSRPKD